jgi:hypothetical protein
LDIVQQRGETAQRSWHEYWFLDDAMKMGLLSKMAPPPKMQSDFSSMLFSGAVPSTASYEARDSHLHFLNCLKIQCESSTSKTDEETRAIYLYRLDTASKLMLALRKKK